MACSIIHVVLKKVAVVVRRTSKGEKKGEDSHLCTVLREQAHTVADLFTHD